LLSNLCIGPLIPQVCIFLKQKMAIITTHYGVQNVTELSSIKYYHYWFVVWGMTIYCWDIIWFWRGGGWRAEVKGTASPDFSVRYIY
jgi:hypothetical protein